MSNRIFPLCGVAIRLATVSPPVCVCVCVCVSYSVILCCTAYMHRLTHRTNMFHPNRQVKAKGQIGIQPCWKVWLSLKLTLSVTHLLWTMTINRGDFVSLFLHPGHVTSRLHIHLYTVYNVKRPVNLTPLFGLVVEAKGTAGNPCRDMEGMKTPHKESTVDQKGMLIFFFCCAETVLTTALQCHRKDKRKIMAQDTFRRKKNLSFVWNWHKCVV